MSQQEIYTIMKDGKWYTLDELIAKMKKPRQTVIKSVNTIDGKAGVHIEKRFTGPWLNQGISYRMGTKK